jgi:hypothetical protein
LFFVPIALILFASFSVAQDNVIDLSNANVLSMVNAKVPPDVIVTKIQTSRCHFDVFPTVISDLRYRGVPDEILVAMVEAPVGRPTKRVEKVAKQQTESASGSVTTEPTERHATTSSASTKKLATEPVMNAAKEKLATEPVTTALTKKPETVTIAPTEKAATAVATATPRETPKQAAAPQQVLTNDDLIQLLRDGLSPTNVATTIKTTRGNYNFSAKALRALQEAGADATVFLAMMEADLQNKKPAENNNLTKTSKP